MSNKQQAKTERALREAMAEQMRTMGVSPDGVTMAIEHGTFKSDPKKFKALIETEHLGAHNLLVCDRCGEIDTPVNGLRAVDGAQHACGGTFRTITRKEWYRRRNARRHALRAETLAALAPLKAVVTLTEEEYLKLLRDSNRGRNLACYILGRTAGLKTAGDFRDALEAVREKCNGEVAHG